MYSTRPQWHRVYHLAKDGCSMTTLCHRVQSSQAHILLVVKTTRGDRFGAFVTSLGKGSPLEHYSKIGNTKEYGGTGGTFVFSLNASVENAGKAGRKSLSGADVMGEEDALASETTPPVEAPPEPVTAEAKIEIALSPEPRPDEPTEAEKVSVDTNSQTPINDIAAGPAETLDKEQEQKEPKALVYKSSGQNDYFVLCDAKSIAVGGGSTGAALHILHDRNDLYHGTSYACETFDTPGPLGSEESFEILDLEAWTVPRVPLSEEALEESARLRDEEAALAQGWIAPPQSTAP